MVLPAQTFMRGAASSRSSALCSAPHKAEKWTVRLCLSPLIDTRGHGGLIQGAGERQLNVAMVVAKNSNCVKLAMVSMLQMRLPFTITVEPAPGWPDQPCPSNFMTRNCVSVNFGISRFSPSRHRAVESRRRCLYRTIASFHQPELPLDCHHPGVICPCSSDTHPHFL